MNRLLTVLLITASTSLMALELQLDMGTGLFYTGAKGKIEYVEKSFQGSYAETDLANSGQFYIWGVITSKNRYVPKVRLEYLKISADGDSKAHLQSSDPTIQDLIDQYIDPLSLNDNDWNSHLQHNIYDVSLYYEFFEESGWPSVGLGLSYQYFDYIYIMDIDLVPGLQFGDRDSSSAPLLFFTSRYESASLQMGFEADAKVYVFGDSQMYDWKIKMDLMFDITETTEAGFEFGFRDQYYQLLGDDVEKVKGDMHYQGVYVGAVVHFN